MGYCNEGLIVGQIQRDCKNQNQNQNQQKKSYLKFVVNSKTASKITVTILMRKNPVFN